MRWKDFGSAARKKRLTRRQVHENVFIELEYVDEAMRSAEPAAFAQVHNLVGTCQLKSSSRLNLETICRFLPNSVYEKQKFAAITIRLGSPKCTTLLFTSGKMVLTGCKSFIEVLLASMNCLYTLRTFLPGVQFELCDVAIQNIVGNADLRLAPHERLDLNAFYRDFNVHCTYQPNMFPGLIYRPAHVEIVVLLFFSGRVVLTGARTMSAVYGGWRKLYPLVKEYRRAGPPEPEAVAGAGAGAETGAAGAAAGAAGAGVGEDTGTVVVTAGGEGGAQKNKDRVAPVARARTPGFQDKKNKLRI
jgi:transcription initiation factor TFIID TATA-box-binding protein